MRALRPVPDAAPTTGVNSTALLRDRLRGHLISQAVRLLVLVAERPRSQRQWVAVGIDALLCVAAAWTAYCLRVGVLGLNTRSVALVSIVALLFWYPIAWWSSVYRSIIRFSGGRTMAGLGAACALLTVPMFVAFTLVGVPGVPRTVGLIHPILYLSLLAISRMAMRFALTEILHNGPKGQVRRNVLVYGAGRAGQQLALSLRHEPHMSVVAFLDDDVRLHGQYLDGTKIYRADGLAALMERIDIDEVLLALPQATRARKRAIVADLQTKDLPVRSLPSLAHIIDGHVTVNDLRQVQIDELLGREPVAPHELLMGKTLAGKVVLVTGAGGSIGSELCRQILRCHPARLVLVEQSEIGLYAIHSELGELIDAEALSCIVLPELGNVADASAIERIVEKHSPDTLFHAAAYKHVPMIEANPIAGIRNNVFGTLHTVRAAEKAGVSTFILISTDKAVRPTNIMGASKRVCELILQARGAEAADNVFTMVRFGNVLGSSGSVVPRFTNQIAAGGPVTVTHRDVTRYFMTIPEASQLVIQAGAMARGGEVFVLDMGQPIKIMDLAVTMIRLSGLTVQSATHPDGDIAINESGLRPGEKLYEELLIGEDPQPTIHERIMRANEGHLTWDALLPQLDALNAALASGDANLSIAIVRALVPEFVHEQAAASRRA